MATISKFSPLIFETHFSFHLSNPCEIMPRVSDKTIQILIEFVINITVP